MYLNSQTQVPLYAIVRWKVLTILALPGADPGWRLKFFVKDLKSHQVNASMVLYVGMTVGGIFLQNIGISVPDYLVSCCARF